MEWTDESIARLRALWQEGLSTAEIGRRMQITKNAVVGKAHRLDLPARPSPIRKTELATGTNQPRRATPVADKPRAVESSVDTQPARAPSIAPVAVIASSAPVTMEAPQPSPVAETNLAQPDTALHEQPVPAISRDTAPGPASPPDNVRLLRPDMPNPAVTPPAPQTETEPRSEPVRTVRAAEPREPRRRGLTCCWPLGEPGTKGFHFCGADPTPGKPYCAEHAALAYVKLRDRRDSVA